MSKKNEICRPPPQISASQRKCPSPSTIICQLFDNNNKPYKWVVEEDVHKRRRWVDKDRKEMLSAITDASLDELIEKF